MNEILETVNRDQTSESIFDSVYKQLSSFHYPDNSEPVISPVLVPNIERSLFASSLMDYSDYQNKFKEIPYELDPLLNFTRGKLRKISFKQKVLIKSHICGLNI